MACWLELSRNTVSTHSRPKAAGYLSAGGYRDANGFNTQPPEGGWPARYLPIFYV